MVLQNKYKARASRRYNAARGGASDGRGRGGGGRGRGRGRQFTTDPAHFPSLDGQEDGGGEDDDEDHSDEGSGQEADGDAEERRAERSKYAPRKLTSNAWRFQQEENDDQAEGVGEEESEPEVDLSAVLKHVVNLDSNRTSKAISSEQLARDKLDAESADVDVSLLPLMQRRQRREDEERAVASRRSKAGDGSSSSKRFLEDQERRAPQRHALTDEQRRELEQEGRRLQIEKDRQEKHERRARIFQQQSKIMSLDGSGSLKKSDTSKSSSTRQDDKSAEMNRSAHLYEEDSSAETNLRGGQVDDFLDELGNDDGQNSSNKSRYGGRTSFQAPSRARQVQTSRRAPPPVEQAQTEEDFLDSVLS